MNLHEKLSALREEIPSYVQKDKKNKMQGYSYLSEAKIKEIVKELLPKNGINFTYGVHTVSQYEISPTSKGTKQFCTVANGRYRFTDISNPEDYMEEGWAGTGTDTGDKGLYKAITGGIKYIFNTTFNIPTGDDPEEDNGKEEPQTTRSSTNPISIEGDKSNNPITPNQVKLLFAKLKNKKLEPDFITTKYGVKELKEIKIGQMTEALKFIFDYDDKSDVPF